MAVIALDVLPVNGDWVRVLSALAGLGCVVAPVQGGWLQVQVDVDVDGSAAASVLEAVTARLAPVAVRVILRGQPAMASV